MAVRRFSIALGVVVVGAFVFRLVYVVVRLRHEPFGGDSLYYSLQGHDLARAPKPRPCSKKHCPATERATSPPAPPAFSGTSPRSPYTPRTMRSHDSTPKKPCKSAGPHTPARPWPRDCASSRSSTHAPATST